MDTWAQKAEENIELFSNATRGAEAGRMLEINSTNRIIVDDDQALIQQIGRFVTHRFVSLKNKYSGDTLPVMASSSIENIKKKDNGYDFLERLFDGVEQYQATRDGKTRSDFKEVAIAQGIGAMNQLKKEFSNLAVK